METLQGNPGEKIALGKWEVKGYYPYVPFLGNSLETGNHLLGLTDWIPAQVPGCVHYDLWQAGLIPDPYYGQNSLACEWVENRWWLYRTRFDWRKTRGQQVYLQFKGLDHKAHIYLNQQLLGTHEGMFEPVEFDVTELLQDADNELLVLFEHVPEVMPQIGYTSDSKVVKSQFAYKWDFCTRMVPTGIWEEALLHVTGDARIEETWLCSRLAGDRATLAVTSQVRQQESTTPLEMEVELSYQGECVARGAQTIGANDATCTMELTVEQPKLWFPNGSGEQPIYDVSVLLKRADRVVDEWHGTTGFREIRFEQNTGSDPEALPYTLVVNGKRVYIKGVNLTPFDILYGTLTRERYEYFISLLKEANINFVRINGIGITEKEDFYDLCDHYGILIWQDFIQSNCGLDAVPSKDPSFLAMLEKAAISALKMKRNHPSLACWCGGNELKTSDELPVDESDENIALLRNLVEEHDPGRMFFPSTSSGPNFFLDVETPGGNHDVHGPWKYAGAEGHYRLYNLSDSLLHSEFGVDGMASIHSLRRFLPPEDLRVTDMAENLTWRHHGEWWDTLERDRQLFGPFTDLPEFIAASQWTQAEGLRYALEANRRRKYQNSGSIVWQFNEPWPNVSCTSVVDYYGRPKMAYHWLRKAYAPLHASLRYEKLGFRAGERFTSECFIHSSHYEGSLHWHAECFDMRGRILWSDEGEMQVEPNSVTPVKDLSFVVEPTYLGLFAIRLRLHTTEGAVDENVYLFSSVDDGPLFAGVRELVKPTLACKSSAEQSESGPCGFPCHRYHITNTGKTAALYVRTDSPALVYSPQDYSVLLPGESQDYDVYVDEESPESVYFRCMLGS